MEFKRTVVLIDKYQPENRPTQKEMIDLEARGLGAKEVTFYTCDTMQDVYKRIAKYVFFTF